MLRAGLTLALTARVHCSSLTLRSSAWIAGRHADIGCTAASPPQPDAVAAGWGSHMGRFRCLHRFGAEPIQGFLAGVKGAARGPPAQCVRRIKSAAARATPLPRPPAIGVDSLQSCQRGVPLPRELTVALVLSAGAHSNMNF